jgi:hypothetical protein
VEPRASPIPVKLLPQGFLLQVFISLKDFPMISDGYPLDTHWVSQNKQQWALQALQGFMLFIKPTTLLQSSRVFTLH